MGHVPLAVGPHRVVGSQIVGGMEPPAQSFLAGQSLQVAFPLVIKLNWHFDMCPVIKMCSVCVAMIPALIPLWGLFCMGLRPFWRLLPRFLRHCGIGRSPKVIER